MNEMLGRLVKLIVTMPDFSFVSGVLCDLVEKLSSTKRKEWYTQLTRFLRQEPCWVTAVVEKVEQVKIYLRQIFTDVELGATDGTETFQSSGLFTSGIYGLAVPAAAKGKATLATKATVWEMILDGIFALLFGSLGHERKRWTEAQVIRFCHDRCGKLRTGRYGTFFEMEGDVVADVRVDERGQLEVDVNSFSHDRVWHARCRHRLVTLQQ